MAHASAVIWTKDLTRGTIITNDLLTRIQICTKQGMERFGKTIEAQAGHANITPSQGCGCAIGDLAWVVRKVDNTIHWINHYPVDSAVCFVNTYPLGSDLSGGQRYPAYEQLGPGVENVSATHTRPWPSSITSVIRTLLLRSIRVEMQLFSDTQ